jgi:hypothetical protein
MEIKEFYLWFSPKYDMVHLKLLRLTQAICQMIYKAGYNGLEDYWKTKSEKGGK